MPILLIYGIPEKVSQASLVTISKDLIEVITSFKELNLKEEDIKVFFPADKMKRARGEKIVIFVRGLFKKPERTQIVKEKLALSLVGKMATKSLAEFSASIKAECFIEPFDPEKGFANI